MNKSVQPEWALKLTVQQQSVLFLACRGPDGVAKSHPCKDVQRAYRGTVLVAARYGRLLKWGEAADSFMSLEVIADSAGWLVVTKRFLESIDDLPLHFVMHLAHGAEILGYKHPDELFRDRWIRFYRAVVHNLHLAPESEAEMDMRLGDWGRSEW